MYKKFKILKPGIFVGDHPNRQAAPVGSIVQYSSTQRQLIRNQTYFGQMEQVADDAVVTCGPGSN